MNLRSRDEREGPKPAALATAKRLAYWIATLVVAPSLLSFWLRSRLLGRDRALHGSSQMLSLVPGLAGQYVRRAFYIRALAACHQTVVIEFGAVFSKAGARVGANAYVGPGCSVGLADIGPDALVAAGVHIPSGPMTHGVADLSRPIREQPGELRIVRIGAGAWIGSGAIVMADVGRGSVVAAGAVVTKEIPDKVIAAGVPARVIRTRGASEPPGGKTGDDGAAVPVDAPRVLAQSEAGEVTRDLPA